jgi:molecular chaperone DnaK
MPSQIVSKAIGIDLGTTNSAVAMMDPTDTKLILHRDERTKSETTPSCVWKDPRSGEIVVGRMAFRRIGTRPTPVRSIKRLMGQQTRVTLTNEEVTPEEVSAHILREMKKQIDQDLAALSTSEVEWITDRAIITVPAYFDQPQIAATRAAGEQAGFQVIDLLHEPTAAACYYCWSTKTQDGVFLVYDLGGGTFDVSVLRCTAGVFEVLGISGNTRLGGDDLDAAIAEYLRKRLMDDGWALDLDLKNDPEDRLRFDKLKFLAESIKKSLSTTNEFYLRDTATLQDKEGNSVIIETMFERTEIEDVIRPIIERTLPYCTEALERAAKRTDPVVTLDKVDAVLLAGGSTHIPLVREMVRQALCADPAVKEPRARCAEPVYEKVDTVVALGAAIRASAVGGLAVYNPERTVRVSFRGTASTGRKETFIGGTVEALSADLSIAGGTVRLTIDDLDFSEDQDLKEGGSFAFRQVPLQPGAETNLSFTIFDAAGNRLATAGRPVTSNKDTIRPTGGAGSTSTLSKAILLEVDHGGKPFLKELIAVMTTLPTAAEYKFLHPGETETIILPLYQQRRKIQEVRIKVPASLPRGTLIQLNLQIDQLSFITAVGKIGDIPFDFAVEPPPDRKLPSAAEVQTLEREFAEAVSYLPAGRRAVAEARYRRAKTAFETAVKNGDEGQAVHEYEEMEALKAEFASAASPLQPGKEVFDDMVRECYEFNREAAALVKEAGKPYDEPEISKAIDAQRVQGEKALNESDQKAYTDAIMMLESLKKHILGIYQKNVKQPEDPRTPEQKTADYAEYVQQQAVKIGQLAAAQKNASIQAEAEKIARRAAELSAEAARNPKAAQQQLGQLQAQLEQYKNVLMGGGAGEKKAGGKFVLDTDL